MLRENYQFYSIYSGRTEYTVLTHYIYVSVGENKLQNTYFSHSARTSHNKHNLNATKEPSVCLLPVTTAPGISGGNMQ